MRSYYIDIETGVAHIVDDEKSMALIEIMAIQKEIDQLEIENQRLLDEIAGHWSNLFHND